MVHAAHLYHMHEHEHVKPENCVIVGRYLCRRLIIGRLPHAWNRMKHY